jgi:hypothetical protein
MDGGLDLPVAGLLGVDYLAGLGTAATAPEERAALKATPHRPVVRTALSSASLASLLGGTMSGWSRGSSLPLTPEASAGAQHESSRTDTDGSAEPSAGRGRRRPPLRPLAVLAAHGAEGGREEAPSGSPRAHRLASASAAARERLPEDACAATGDEDAGSGSGSGSASPKPDATGEVEGAEGVATTPRVRGDAGGQAQGGSAALLPPFVSRLRGTGAPGSPGDTLAGRSPVRDRPGNSTPVLSTGVGDAPRAAAGLAASQPPAAGALAQAQLAAGAGLRVFALPSALTEQQLSQLLAMHQTAHGQTLKDAPAPARLVDLTSLLGVEGLAGAGAQAGLLGGGQLTSPLLQQLLLQQLQQQQQQGQRQQALLQQLLRGQPATWTAAMGMAVNGRPVTSQPPASLSALMGTAQQRPGSKAGGQGYGSIGGAGVPGASAQTPLQELQSMATALAVKADPHAKGVEEGEDAKADLGSSVAAGAPGLEPSSVDGAAVDAESAGPAQPAAGPAAAALADSFADVADAGMEDTVADGEGEDEDEPGK